MLATTSQVLLAHGERDDEGHGHERDRYQEHVIHGACKRLEHQTLDRFRKSLDRGHIVGVDLSGRSVSRGSHDLAQMVLEPYVQDRAEQRGADGATHGTEESHRGGGYTHVSPIDAVLYGRN